MSEPLLRIHNRHTASCGDPPIVSNDDPDLYIGYFENAFGEQWIFTCNRKTRQAELRGGDAGWNEAYPVTDGKAQSLILGRKEASWLEACWRAAVGL
jgi:hypothetical protein